VSWVCRSDFLLRREAAEKRAKPRRSEKRSAKISDVVVMFFHGDCALPLLYRAAPYS
jgi:hypothetical protein